jgi:hypothetical protein
LSEAETPFPYQLITCASGLFADYSRKHVLKSLRDHFDDAGETLCVQVAFVHVRLSVHLLTNITSQDEAMNSKSIAFNIFSIPECM